MAGTWDFGNFRFLEKCLGPIFQKPTKNGIWKNPGLPGSQIPLLAIHKIISHIWEDRSRKVNNDEPNLRFFYGNFWPVISRTVRKPCFSTSIPRGPTHLGLAWAHPRGPSLGPPTWAHPLGFPDAARRILKSRSRPLPTHPGMKYFRKETLAVDHKAN